MHKKTPLYEFHVLWNYLAGDNPEERHVTVVTALSVPNALVHFYRAMTAAGYGESRKGFHVLEVANAGLSGRIPAHG